MRQGFIFDMALCVNCKSCSAACMLENGWSFPARKIFIGNSEAFNDTAVVNISMACNHCDQPACLLGCPTSAYYRDETTGAVITDPARCIGCRYCTWNCPYGAPIFNNRTGVIEKCNLCFNILKQGYSPACAGACPTGALSFGPLIAGANKIESVLVPEKGLEPAMQIKNGYHTSGPEIIPARSWMTEPVKIAGERKIGSEFSLAVFSFLAMMSVSLTIAGLFGEVPYTNLIPLALIILAGLTSFLHLRSPFRSWRTIFNLRNSPLSREIASLIIYGLTLILCTINDYPAIKLIASFSGLILLIMIDEVYNYSAGSKSRFHSGTTFLSALQIISFLSGHVSAFLFISVTRIILIFASGALTKTGRTYFATRFHRLSLLLIVSLSLIAGQGTNSIITLIILLASEFADRLLFYLDFDPVNIKTTIENKRS